MGEDAADVLWRRLLAALDETLSSISLQGLGISRRLVSTNPEAAMQRAETIAYKATHRRRAVLTALFVEDESESARI